MSEFDQKLRARLSKAGLNASAQEIAQLKAYFTLLTRWNARINLTALHLEGLPDATLDRLFVEPLAAAAHVPPLPLAWFDIGSGGGSPAIPLKVVRPAMNLTMVESRGKKAAFLREVVRELGLVGSDIAETRFEALAGAVSPASVDLVTLRAVKFDEPLAKVIRNVLTRNGKILIFQTSPVGSVQSWEHFVSSKTAQLADTQAFLHILELG